MSATLRAFLFCDAPGHDGDPFDDNTVPSATTQAEARREARQSGWHRTRSGRGICPDCWADGHR